MLDDRLRAADARDRHGDGGGQAERIRRVKSKSGLRRCFDRSKPFSPRRNTRGMTPHETLCRFVLSRANNDSSPLEASTLSAHAVIDRSGAANVIALLRVRMGFPTESFVLAAQPLLDDFAQFVQLRPASGCSCYGCPGGQLQRGLVAALRALDRRRGQILPRNAPPEVLGALVHRWTYAVFAAALLRDIDAESPGAALEIFERSVLPHVREWLAEAPALMAELQAVLSGHADASSAIAELAGYAATDACAEVASTEPRVTMQSTASPEESSGPIQRLRSASDEREFLECSEGSEPEFLDGVNAAGNDGARRFLRWVRQAIADGLLSVNVRGALVHGVEDGLLLASPAIFRTFVRCHGGGDRDRGDSVKRLQRDVLRAGWHLRGAGGVNLHGYAWKEGSDSRARIHGIVIVAPQRFFDPVPEINPALERIRASASEAV